MERRSERAMAETASGLMNPEEFFRW